MVIHADFAIAFAIIAASFLSEDAAVLSAASLAASHLLSVRLAALSAIAGVFIGDVALFSVARLVSKGVVRWDWAHRLTESAAVCSFRHSFQRRARWALFFSRALPGTRLPMTLACGLFSMPVQEFLAFSLAGASLWVAATFYLLHKLHYHLSTATLFVASVACLAIAIGAGHLLRRNFPSLSRTLRRWQRWEFWPGWLFYIPVVAACVWLALKHRSLSLPALANPGQLNGGIVGESKSQMIADLVRAAPELVADGYLIPAATTASRIKTFDSITAQHRLEYPMVLKPEIGQRGAGFRVIHSRQEALAYLGSVGAPLIAQRYAAGPHEASIFYYRRPFESRGHILAITEKIFPCVIGDGRRTLAQLIEDDDRSSLIADVYLRRFGAAADDIVPKGHCVRLVQAGNHCQGCIFRNGTHLNTEDLRATIDRISQALPGFFIGRYDIRYDDRVQFLLGRSFRIVELNGAASEATSIYDERTSLAAAYRMLYQQWSLVFEVGACNRRAGLETPGVPALWRSWKEYCRISTFYPVAD